MEKYGYLYICLFLIIPCGLLYLYNPRLRNRLIKAGLIAIPFAFVEDVWFRIDYWYPPEILSIYPFGLEDILFAFLKTGIGITLFDALFTKKQEVAYKQRKGIALIFFPFVILSFYILNNVLGVNSMYMWAISFFIVTLVILIFRKDLIIPSLVSAILFTIIVIPIYMLLFNFLIPNFWDEYWYLAETKHGLKVFGNVPVLELLYYFSFSCVCAIMYDFAKGTKKIPNKLGKKLFG